MFVKYIYLKSNDAEKIMISLETHKVLILLCDPFSHLSAKLELNLGFFFLLAEVEKENSGSLESVPTSFYDSVVSDFSEYLGDHSLHYSNTSSPAGTPKPQPTSNNVTSYTNGSAVTTDSTNPASQVSSTTKSSVNPNGVVLSEGKYNITFHSIFGIMI